MAKTQAWRDYEEVAQYLINEMADHFGLEGMEGKQRIPGDSGTQWEIEGKGVVVGDEGFVILECKRYTKNKVNQETTGGLAFRIHDTNAQGALLVSPFGLQAGARKVAEATDITEVTLTSGSTKTEYVLKFLNNAFIGVTDTISSAEDAVVIELNPREDDS